MSDGLYMVILHIFLFGNVILCYKSKHPWALTSHIIITMMILGIFPNRNIQFLDLSLNVGSIYFTYITLAQFLIYVKYGYNLATASIFRVIRILLFFLGFCFLMNAAYPNDEYVQAVTNNVGSVVFVSYIAFAISSMIFFWVLDWSKEKKHPFWLYFLGGILISQTVDSLIFFFGILMNSDTHKKILEISLYSLTTKMIYSTLISPAVYVLITHFKPRTSCPFEDNDSCLMGRSTRRISND